VVEAEGGEQEAGRSPVKRRHTAAALRSSPAGPRLGSPNNSVSPYPTPGATVRAGARANTLTLKPEP
jgi:hypothetical protein